MSDRTISDQIVQTMSSQFAPDRIRQTVSGKSAAILISESSNRKSFDIPALAQAFPLPWSAYVRLLSVRRPQARVLYETEALLGGWSVRQLDRQVNNVEGGV